MATVARVDVRLVRRSLRTTFSTSLGQKHHLASLLVTVTLSDGAYGLGEVPTSIALGHETLDVIRRLLIEARRRLQGLAIDDWAEWIRRFRKEHRDTPMTVSGLEVALFRAHLAESSVSEHAHWGASCGTIETDITIPLVRDSRSVEHWIGAAARKGFTVFKLKVGGRRDEDESLVSTVYRTLQSRVPGFRLRLDGNQGYSVATFLRFQSYIENHGYSIELFEQPLPKDDYKGYREIRNKSAMPIVLDESVIGLGDARRAIDNGLCDGINIKVAKSGLLESAAMVDLARRAGLKLMIGCMIETMVGLSAAIFFAAGTGAFDYIDLDSVHFLYGKNSYSGIDFSGPSIAVL